MDMSEIEKLERAKVGTIKLSEAMRIGAMKRPQIRGRFFKEGFGSCAIGAAWEGMGFGFEDEGWMVYETVCPRLGITVDLGERIARMNDKQGWTREQIADWLERQGY